MVPKKFALAPRDPFTFLRQLTSDFDRMFETSGWPSLRWPVVGTRSASEAATWFPETDVFERDNLLIAKIDLPGLKKEDVKVEVADGRLTVSGERKSESEEKAGNFYRCERYYGSFYRAVPLPEGAKLEDVKATFGDGVLEVSIPLPVKPAAKSRQVEVQEVQVPVTTAA